jgi:hypothetical protein
MILLGWILFVFNITALFFFIYNLQFEVNRIYLFATGVVLSQIIYIAKTLRVLKKFELARKMMESAAKKAGLDMAKIVSGKKGERGK